MVHRMFFVAEIQTMNDMRKNSSLAATCEKAPKRFVMPRLPIVVTECTLFC